MSSSDPRVQRSRAAILASALSLLQERGVNGVTVDAVVADSGVAKTTVYRHWPSRDALLAEVFRHFEHDLPHQAPGQTPLEAIRAQARALAATLSRPEWQRTLPALLDIARRSEEFAHLHGASMPGMGAMSMTIARAIDEGYLPEARDPGQVLAMVVGPLTVTALFAPSALDETLADDIVMRIARAFGGSAEVSTKRGGPLP